MIKCNSCKKKTSKNQKYRIIRTIYRFDSFLNETNHYCQSCYYWKGYFITEEMVIGFLLIIILIIFCVSWVVG